jgi:hypothetical protein
MLLLLLPAAPAVALFHLGRCLDARRTLTSVLQVRQQQQQQKPKQRCTHNLFFKELVASAWGAKLCSTQQQGGQLQQALTPGRYKC